MQLDLETIRWVLSSVFILCGGLISWLLNRQVTAIDTGLANTSEAVKSLEDDLAEFQLDVSKNYVSKMELRMQLESQLGPLHDDMRDIKNDIKSLLKRP